MLIQPSSIGAFIGLIIGSVIFTHISGLYSTIKRIRIKKPSVDKAVNFFLATICFFLTVFIGAWSFNFLSELWREASEISDRIAILRVISSFALSAVIGTTTAYIAYKQYTLARGNALMEETRKFMERSNK